VGKIVPEVEIQVRHIDTGATLGANEQGEICVAAPTLFLEYYDNPVVRKNKI